MSRRMFQFGPVFVPDAIGNLLSPGTGISVTAGAGLPAEIAKIRLVLTRLRVTNVSASSRTVSTYIGATGGQAAGTEFLWSSKPLPANTSFDNYDEWHGEHPIEPGKYLTGIASLVSTVSLEGEFYAEIAP